MGVARGISDRKALATTGHGEDLHSIRQFHLLF
jgi:hypothetical protein